MPLTEKLTKHTTVGPTNTIFSWEDVIASIGYKTFFALRNNEGDSLVTTSTESNDARTSVPNGNTEINFDHTFLTASDIEGQGMITATLEINAVSPGTDSLRLNIRLLHVDSANAETEIVGTIVSDEVVATIETRTRRVTVTMDIPLTHFAIGEKVRLEIICVVVLNNSGIFLWHDPANRGTPPDEVEVGATPRSDLTLTLPFRLPI